MNLHQYILFFTLVVIMETALAGEVEIVEIVFVQQGKSWRVDTTLRHSDSGWKTPYRWLADSKQQGQGIRILKTFASVCQ